MAPPNELAGWLPAIILPLSTAIQLVRLVRERTAAGTSALTWGLFAVANFGAYAFTGRPGAPQALLAFLLTGVLDVVIVAVILVLSRRDRAEARSPPGDLP